MMMTCPGAVWTKSATGLALALCAVAVDATPSAAAATLLAKRTELQAQLQAQPFGEPLVLQSREDGKRLDGDAYAELAQPFARVGTVLANGESVCGVLFLHLNVRSCQASPGDDGEQLTLAAGPKQRSAFGTVYSMAYAMRVEANTPDYLRVSLVAASGPMSTSDYRIVFEATPLDGQRSFLHFAYGYTISTMARMALGAYLATAGRSKIGFTVLGKGPDGRAQYVQGERGSLERNVMRNYLALQAYTSVQSGTPQAQTEARLRAWFALTERYPAQLHELELEQYLQEKHTDLERMAASAR
jgi:hypothetical protein